MDPNFTVVTGPEENVSSSIFAIRGDLDGGKESHDFHGIKQFVGLLISGNEFLLPVEVMNEIIMIHQLTFVPHAPKFVEGVINLRGRIVPAVNLRQLMGHETSPPTAASRIIITTCDNEVLGLIVDGISYVLSLNQDQLEDQSLSSGGHGAQLVKGIAKRGSQVHGILDIAKVLATVRENLPKNGAKEELEAAS